MGGSRIGNGMPRSESVYPGLRGSHPHPTQRVILFAYVCVAGLLLRARRAARRAFTVNYGVSPYVGVFPSPHHLFGLEACIR